MAELEQVVVGGHRQALGQHAARLLQCGEGSGHPAREAQGSKRGRVADQASALQHSNEVCTLFIPAQQAHRSREEAAVLEQEPSISTSVIVSISISKHRLQHQQGLASLYRSNRLRCPSTSASSRLYTAGRSQRRIQGCTVLQECLEDALENSRTKALRHGPPRRDSGMLAGATGTSAQEQGTGGEAPAHKQCRVPAVSRNVAGREAAAQSQPLCAGVVCMAGGCGATSPDISYSFCRNISPYVTPGAYWMSLKCFTPCGRGRRKKRGRGRSPGS